VPPYPHINTPSYKLVDTWKAIYAGIPLHCVGEKLGTLNIVLPDDLERKLRVTVAERGGKKGDLSGSVEEAIKDWLEKFDERHGKKR
jgi:hypothetical protein